MNLVLFSPEEIARPLPRTDPRAIHLLTVLRRAPGDSFDAGLINGPRGKGTVAEIGIDVLSLTFAWGEAPAPLPRFDLVVGLPRPQTARDVLRDASTLGVSALHFVQTDTGEPSYASSSLWQSGEWRQRLREGAAQAFDTRLPEVHHHPDLAAALAWLPPGATRLALDNYEATRSLADISLPAPESAVLAVGSERGWSAGERTALRSNGFTLVHLGPRVLRTETACVAGITLLRARLGWL